MGWGSIFSIIDKFIPTRKARLRNEIRDLERALAIALKCGNDTQASYIRKRLRDLREEINAD